MKFDNGHWKHTEQLSPKQNQGFIYLVSNTTNGRVYIGKKNYFSITTLPPLKGYKRKRKKITEMDWRNYTSSSVELNEDIKALGKDKFEFHILSECKTKGDLTYAEANLQHSANVLTEKLDDGKTPRYYNRQIGAIKFIPASPVRDSTREKLRKLALKLPKVKCEHCKAVTQKPNHVRWHGDNCKKKGK